MTRILGMHTTREYINRECIAREFKNQGSITREFWKCTLLCLRACIQKRESVFLLPTFLTSLRDNFLCGILLIFLYCCINHLWKLTFLKYILSNFIFLCKIIPAMYVSDKYFFPKNLFYDYIFRANTVPANKTFSAKYLSRISISRVKYFLIRYRSR